MWKLNFISEKDLKENIKNTIEAYLNAMNNVDLNDLIETNYCAKNLTVLATGNIDHEELQKFIDGLK